MRFPRLLAAAALLLAFVAGLLAHVRLVHPTNGNPLYWSNPANVPIIINDAGSDDVPDWSDETALRMAIQRWNEIGGTSATLVEDASPASQARTDWMSSDIHLLYFDEGNSSGYFPGFSGIVAITPVWFFSNGTISDADNLFNGEDHRFTTSQQSTRFDIGDVATHELGHFLGLDHSAWAGATMYPYVDPSVILHRSLSEDEERGLRTAFPSGSFGQISGRVLRAAGSTAVAGAHVVARDSAGRTAGSVLTNAAGYFVLRGLDPDVYTVYAVPLGDGSGTGSDAPVDASNLTSWHTIQTDFQAGIYAQTALITGANAVAMGTLPVGPDVQLNLGTESDRFPVRAIAGASQTVLLRGAGLLPPATLEASDPDVIVGTPMWFGSQVSFQVTVPGSEPAGHVDLTVTNSFGERSILPAALEITPPSPTVSGVSPGMGAAAGGTPVTITGANFNSGARIVIGDQIYTDGAAGTAVSDPTTILLTTLPTATGTHDVVVIDATGVEGRRLGAFQVLALPTITTVFPPAGYELGGTEVVVTGQAFQAGVVVRIDGIDQGPVTYEGSTRIRFSTANGALGPQALEVENPDGGTAASTFTYSQQPDPAIAFASPTSGNMGGGQTITISGANFTAAMNVLFDVDPNTGAGGTAAATVTFVDSSTLSVTTPSFSSAGTKSVCVIDPGTGQSDVLAGAFLVNSGGGGGGGGGGCYVAPFDEPESPQGLLAGLWWFALVILVLAARSRRHVERLA